MLHIPDTLNEIVTVDSEQQQAQQDAITSAIDTMIETEIQILISGQGNQQIIGASGGSLGM